MKVALVYDRVSKWGGAERVLLVLHEMFPKAPLYTLLYNPKTASWAKVFPEIIPSFLQKIPLARTNHEYLAPFAPMAFESFDFRGFDLVISVTSEAAKGIITTPSTKHVCYCLTPTRYLWSGYDEYFKNSILRGLSKPAVSYLRAWDKVASQRPDKIIAISTAVQRRIKKYYKRNSSVVYPPATLKSNPPISRQKSEREDYFLIVSRMVPYKRVDLAIDAFNRLGRPLVIVGGGNQESRLKRKANKNITFVGQLTDSELVNYYNKAKALIFPQEEDFGLVAAEAQSFGIPVIAFNKGGAQDIIIPGVTGLFFDRQTSDSMTDAVMRFDNISFNKKKIVNNAKRFSKSKFKAKFWKELENV